MGCQCLLHAALQMRAQIPGIAAPAARSPGPASGCLRYCRFPSVILEKMSKLVFQLLGVELQITQLGIELYELKS